MKKLLGVLALVLSVSSLAMADQDTVKEIHFSSEFRQSYTDKKNKYRKWIRNRRIQRTKQRKN